jgi:allantoicase
LVILRPKYLLNPEKESPVMINSLPPDAPGFTRRYLNLADPGLGAEAISATDDFFGPKERMLAPEPPVFIAVS